MAGEFYRIEEAIVAGCDDDDGCNAIAVGIALRVSG